MEITLDQLLASREDRWEHQRLLIRENPGLSLVCLTVIMPGRVKRNIRSLTIAKAAIEAMEDGFRDHIRELTVRDLETGYEAYLLTDLPVQEAKRISCGIEDTHPLGRLFDIDIIGNDGSPVSRNSIGIEARRCLLCGNEARFCMRNHTHSQEELEDHIGKMIDGYVHRS